MKRILICAAEDSGEQLAVSLVRALQRRGSFSFCGLAGRRLQAAGVEALASPDGLAVTGIVEALPVIWQARRVVRQLEAAFDQSRPDLVVTVDAPSLLLRVARAAKRRGIPVVHWICPQVWAWRRGRIPRIARSVDTLLCALPNEPSLFAGLPVRAVFIGHPAADQLRPGPPQPSWVLAPGSRTSELPRLLPVFEEVARRLSGPILVPLAPSVDPSALNGLGTRLVRDPQALAGARAALTCSGTMSLQLGLLGVPQVVVYRTGAITAELLRHLVTVEHIALPNLVLGRGAIPERHQHLDPDELVALLHLVEHSPPLPLHQILALDAVERAADEVLRLL